MDNQSLLMDTPGSLEADAANALAVQEAMDDMNSTQQVGMNPAEASEACKTNLNFLAAIAMPTVFKFMYPVLYLACWHNFLLPALHKVRDFSQLALCLPRGFAKSTFVKLLVLYTILFTRKKFILILAETATKAEAIIADIMDMLDEPNIKAIFGDWRVGVEKDTGPLKKFGFRGRNIIIAGMGAGGSVRGLNMKNARPDMMIFDDVQSREDADSQLVSEGLMKWMVGTAMKAKDPSGCTFLFIGNMYPTQHSIMRKLLTNPTWVKFKTGGIVINPDTGEFESVWEELHPLEELLKQYLNDEAAGHPEIFQAEVLNDENASVNTHVDFEKLVNYPFIDDEVHTGNFIVIDPATDKANADAVSVGYFEVHDAKAVLYDLEVGRLSPSQTIYAALRFCMKYGCRLVVVEGTAYQSTLNFWARQLTGQYGIEGIQWVEIYPGKTSKNSRILTMFKQLQSNELFIHPKIRTPVFAQIRGFNALSSNNVDGILDLLTYAPRVLTEYHQFLSSITIIENQDSEVYEEFSELDNSPF